MISKIQSLFKMTKVGEHITLDIIGTTKEYDPLLFEKIINDIAKKYNQRLTFHPGQYNVVGTPNQKTFQQTCCDLKYHADVLDLMELGDDSVMVIHGGGTYKNKPETIERWCKNYLEMPENIRKRLVLENCEKSFSIEDCLYISEKVGVPVVFDTHHYDCYKLLHPDESFKEASYYIYYITYILRKYYN